MPDISSFNSTVTTMAVTNSVNFGAMLMIIVCIAGSITVFLLISSLERYTKFFDTLYKILYTLKYTALGGGVAVIGYGMYLACSTLVSVGSGVDPMLALGVVAAYVGVTALGYVADKVIVRIRSIHARYVASKVVV
jgi:hypothetical protein